MLDMLRDCNTGIRWVLHHAAQNGGDASRIYLVGQSCGAQLAALALITQVVADTEIYTFPVSQLGLMTWLTLTAPTSSG